MEQNTKQSEKEELPLTPSRIREKRKVYMADKIHSLKTRIENTLIATWNGHNCVSIDISKEDPMVVDEALSFFTGGEGNDNWKIERDGNWLKMSSKAV